MSKPGPRMKVSLAEAFPEVAAEWHPTRNGEVTPQQVSRRSGVKVWWRCDDGHEWEAAPHQRTKGIGCPECRKNHGRMNGPSLSEARPDIAAEWDHEKNGDLRPDRVGTGSRQSVGWVCKKGHQWVAQVTSRVATGSGCPTCAGLKKSGVTLEEGCPEIAAEWHPSLNGDLTPSDLAQFSAVKAWWLCGKGHEWEAVVANRVTGFRRGTGKCPACIGRRVAADNVVSAVAPHLVDEWDETNPLPPDQVIAGSRVKVKWVCKNDAAHRWEAQPNNRITHGTGCPYCSKGWGNTAHVSHSLETICPNIAREWHPTKNGELRADQVLVTSLREVWWRCDAGHEWEERVRNRTHLHGRGKEHTPTDKTALCPSCSTLAVEFPDLAAQWHPTRNGDLRAQDVPARTYQKAWWMCLEGHEWETTVYARRTGQGCPYCAVGGYAVAPGRSLADLFPEVASLWHPTKNGDLTPYQVRPKASKKGVWWKCPGGPDHEWQISPASMTTQGIKASSRGCPFCAGLRPSVTNSLATCNPDIAAEWHPTRNGDLQPTNIVAGSAKKAWWLCGTDPSHEWEASLNDRVASESGCPLCNRGWTVEKIRLLVASLVDHLDGLKPAELYSIFQQNGVLTSHGRGLAFAKALTTGRLPTDEVRKFATRKPSVVDEFIEKGHTTTAEFADLVKDDVTDVVVADPKATNNPMALPAATSVTKTLGGLDAVVAVLADKEAVEFFLSSAVDKMWWSAYVDPAKAIAEAEKFQGSEYADTASRRFLDEIAKVQGFALPSGYSFPYEPNLMQRLVAWRVKDRRNVGNWSGTGAGKTLSAVLASRMIDAKLTVIFCPNNVIDGWAKTAMQAFPDTEVITKTLHPTWKTKGHRYLVVNYDHLQRKGAEAELAALLEVETPEFIVIDEIHQAKQREENVVSLRRERVLGFRAMAAQKNPDVHVLAMSATPVINTLREGRSMVELVTGLEHSDLPTKDTVNNCITLHQKLVTLGTRWLPDYSKDHRLDIETMNVDCDDRLDDIRKLGKADILGLEQILTEVRLPKIIENIVPKTIIYTHLIDGIGKTLRDAVEAAGWRAGFFTGDDKTGIDEFINGKIDVLIGTAAIGTGIDGLQTVCSRLIFNVLPWTNAEFIQIIGRIYRQHQTSDTVRVVVPLTGAEVNDERWSWCQHKMNRLEYKKTVADAAVDGVVPEGHLRSQQQAYKDLMAWLKRLDNGDVAEISRQPIRALLDATSAVQAKRKAGFSEFSKMNNRWNAATSANTHKRLQENPQEWADYHAHYREARKDWPVVPYEEFVKWARKREGYQIGDFGCGEALVADALAGQHTVYSFDHVAVDERVVACDMAHTPLADGSLDVALFCLSLMGSNVTDYIREAHRVLRVDGHLHIYEATSRFGDSPDQFVTGLERMGFDVYRVTPLSRWTHVYAMKLPQAPEANVEVALR